MRTSLPQIPSSVGKSVETSRIRKELIKHQPSTSTHSPMELEPGQPVFVKEVHGNVWKTGTIDQPAKEPESYWVKFPDNSILRRTRSMIKPQSQPSYFKLEAEGREWNNRGHIPPHSHHPFNSNLQAPGDPSFASGQSSSTSFDKQGYTVCNRTHSCQFHWCNSTFHHKQ